MISRSAGFRKGCARRTETQGREHGSARQRIHATDSAGHRNGAVLLPPTSALRERPARTTRCRHRAIAGGAVGTTRSIHGAWLRRAVQDVRPATSLVPRAIVEAFLEAGNLRAGT